MHATACDSSEYTETTYDVLFSAATFVLLPRPSSCRRYVSYTALNGPYGTTAVIFLYTLCSNVERENGHNNLKKFHKRTVNPLNLQTGACLMAKLVYGQCTVATKQVCGNYCTTRL